MWLKRDIPGMLCVQTEAANIGLGNRELPRARPILRFEKQQSVTSTTSILGAGMGTLWQVSSFADNIFSQFWRWTSLCFRAGLGFVSRSDTFYLQHVQARSF